MAVAAAERYQLFAYAAAIAATDGAAVLFYYKILLLFYSSFRRSIHQTLDRFVISVWSIRSLLKKVIKNFAKKSNNKMFDKKVIKNVY